jgi:hypothetical protein
MTIQIEVFRWHAIHFISSSYLIQNVFFVVFYLLAEVLIIWFKIAYLNQTSNHDWTFIIIQYLITIITLLIWRCHIVLVRLNKEQPENRLLNTQLASL